MNPTTRVPWWKQTWLWALILVAATVLVYQPAWHAGFIWDDDDYVTNNPLLTAPDGLKRIWFSTDSPSQYFPLTYTTFRLEHALWGFNPIGYHWVNILLHAVNALLVWRLLKRLNVPGAWFAAAIFALHPVQVESVAWISELKNVQSLFFLLLALLAWVEFVARTSEAAGNVLIGRSAAVSERPAAALDKSNRSSLVSAAAGATHTAALHCASGKVALLYTLALLCHALALFSKTTACTLPAALLLVLWLQHRRITWWRVAQVVPFVVLGLGMGLLSMWWERHHQGTEGAVYAMTFPERVLVASRAIWFYLAKLVWPSDLSFNYPLWKINASNALAWGWLAACLALGAAVWFARRFVGRSVEVALIFFVATLTPLLGFVMLYTFRYTFVADHYQYVAMIGPAALAGAALAGAWSKLRLSKSASSPAKATAQRGSRSAAKSFLLPGALVVLILAMLTRAQSGIYSDLETLWRATLAKNPDSFMAHNNLGAIFLARGQVDDAIVSFERALEISPDHANARGNLGHALLRKGLTAEAIEHFRRALELAPCAKGYSDLGFGLLQAGRVNEAINLCRKAVQLQPTAAEAHNNLGLALNANGRTDDAISCFRLAAKFQPGLTDAHYNLAFALLRAQRVAEAITELQKFADLQPRNAEVRNNLGWVLLQNGRVDEAIACFQTVLKLEPDIVIAHNNLAMALLRKGRPREALEQYRAFLEANPDHAPVLAQMAWVLATWPDAAVRNAAEAMSLAQRAEKLSGGSDPMILRTLAAACAANGRFADAVSAARQALELADARPDAALASALRSQLKLYEAGSPFLDSPDQPLLMGSTLH